MKNHANDVKPLQVESFFSTGSVTHSWDRGDVSQRRRAKYDCPQPLSRYLAKNKQVPANAELKKSLPFDGPVGLAELLTEYKRVYRGQPEMRAYRKSIMDKMAIFGEGEERFCHILRIGLDLYKEFYSNRVYLNQYVDLLDYAKMDVPTRYEENRLPVFPVAVSEIRIEHRPDGLYVETRTAGISDALSSVYGDRLRRCAVCQSIFWAKRKETVACSPECQSTLRTRLSRNRTPEEKAELAQKARGYYSRRKVLDYIRDKKQERT
nr:hypothetical protein [uncultured bacterium]